METFLGISQIIIHQIIELNFILMKIIRTLIGGITVMLLWKIYMKILSLKTLDRITVKMG